MKREFILPTLLATAFLSSCAINQTVEPADIATDAVVCIVENPDVREGFLAELKKVLDEKHINYRVVDKQESLNCEWTATYLGRWNWDLALYMSYAEIKIYKNGQLDGEAIYDASRGGANLGKFIDAETKIRELVDSLIKEVNI